MDKVEYAIKTTTATYLTDLLTSFPLPINYTYGPCHENALQDPGLFNACFKIFKDNMYQQYVNATDTGWNPRTKKAEWLEDGHKLISIHHGDAIVGFCLFHFTMETVGKELEEKPVVYWYFLFILKSIYIPSYELQISSSHQNKSLATSLFKCMRSLAQTFKMHKLVLTVFKENTQAIRFYAKMGMVVDGSSPSFWEDDERRRKRCSYEIMSLEILG